LRLNEPKLDERFSSEMKELFLRLIKLDGINQMLLDLKNVKYVDSGVISAFLMAHRLLRDDPEAVFVLTGLSDSVKRVLNIAHLTTVFDIFDTVEEAMAAIKESISQEPVALESSPDDDRMEKEWKEESSLIRLTDEDDWDEDEEWDEEEDWEEEDWDEEDWEEEEEDWDEDDWDEDEEWEEESSLRSKVVVRLVDEEDWDEEWDEEDDWDDEDWEEEEEWDEDDWDDEDWEEEELSLRSIMRLTDEDDWDEEWDEEEDCDEEDWEEEDWDEDDWDEEEEWEDELS